MNDKKTLNGCTINSRGSLVYPETVSETYGEFTFTYYIEPKKDYEKLRFLSRDIFGVLEQTNPNIDKILVMTDICSDNPPTSRPDNINFALREFAEAHSDTIIACQLYIQANTEEEAVVYRNATFIELIIDLEEAGFVDINSYCQFENSIAFVYRNENSRDLLRFITRLGLRDPYINGVYVEFKDFAEEWYVTLPDRFKIGLKKEASKDGHGITMTQPIEDKKALNIN